jgi:hypothetical protein
MGDTYLDADGVLVPPEALSLPRAVGLARHLSSLDLPYVRLVECRRGTDGEAFEAVVFEAEVERPQVTAHPIRRVERVAVVFREGDTRYPDVLVLRQDFPRTPHQSFRAAEYPRGLCLYDRPWQEVAIRWTPAAFVERVRYWLAQTARGRLHQEDQPLEQLLFDSGTRLVIPVELVGELSAERPIRLDVLLATGRDDCRTFVAVKPPEGPSAAPKFMATVFVARPQTHGIIRHTPANLFELHEFLADGGIDLIGQLRSRIEEWGKPVADRKAGLVIIVAMPLARTEGGEAERHDFWAFMTFETVRRVGVAIGLWGEVGGQLAWQLRFDESDRGRSIPIHVLSPCFEFSRAGAAAANGLKPDGRKVVAVGAGALGSQVIATLARGGFGSWTLVDEDDLLPHNLARHVLDNFDVGNTKATAVANYLDRLYAEAGGTKAIVADVLSPGQKAAELDAAFAESELILDMAASVPVARHLAVEIKSYARRVSVFLNPTGTDVVVLAEAKDRSVPLDAIETQYYRAAATDPRFEGHLGTAPGRLRYGRSCRDITFEMPTHLVAMHAAIASQAVRAAIESESATIRVWRCDPRTMQVVLVDVPANGVYRQEIGGWTLLIDRALLGRLADLRGTKLPNETGGVLLGVYDLSRRHVYVVDTIPSPPDSQEWPTLYIRGSEGLLAKVLAAGAASGGQLEYVGEWHSHPDGCGTSPSADDVTVFMWLTERMDDDGLPALMAIAGQGGASSWYLGRIAPETAWTLD